MIYNSTLSTELRVRDWDTHFYIFDIAEIRDNLMTELVNLSVWYLH